MWIKNWPPYHVDEDLSSFWLENKAGVHGRVWACPGSGSYLSMAQLIFRPCKAATHMCVCAVKVHWTKADVWEQAQVKYGQDGTDVGRNKIQHINVEWLWVCSLQHWNFSYMASECSMICYFKYKNSKKKKILGRGIATATAEVRGHSPSSPHSPYALGVCSFSIPMLPFKNRCWLQHQRRLRLLTDDLKRLLWQWPLQWQWLRLLFGQAPSLVDPGFLGTQTDRPKSMASPVVEFAEIEGWAERDRSVNNWYKLHSSVFQ